MNAKETLERLPFIEAFANGEVVEYHNHNSEVWKQVTDLQTILQFPIYSLRIKPKPLRFKLAVKVVDGKVVDYGSINFVGPQLTQADKEQRWRTITVEEVQE